MHACTHVHTELAKLLPEGGADGNSSDGEGSSGQAESPDGVPQPLAPLKDDPAAVVSVSEDPTHQDGTYKDTNQPAHCELPPPYESGTRIVWRSTLFRCLLLLKFLRIFTVYGTVVQDYQGSTHMLRVNYM